jgi:hypothetical protein
MRTVERWAKALTSAIAFVDIFGENLGDGKLTELISIYSEGTKLIVSNKFGTTKSFTFGNAHTRQIYEEIASNLEGFDTRYPGQVFVHQGTHSGKVITTLSSKLLLTGGKSTRERQAVVILKGKSVEVRYEITETFHQSF